MQSSPVVAASDAKINPIGRTSNVKKLIASISAATLLLGLAMGGQAQTKTPEKPAVKTDTAAPVAKPATQTTETAKPAAPDTGKTGDVAKPGDQGKAKGKDVIKDKGKGNGKGKEEGKGKGQQGVTKPVAPVEKTPEKK
jgi:hypothetical protein